MTNIVVEPSRFDKANPGKLLSGIAGNWLMYQVEKYDREIRVVDYTKLRHAEPASHWLTLGANPKMHTIGVAQEGYSYTYKRGRLIPSFDAQQANDASTSLEDDSREDESDVQEDIREAKDLQITRHSNWRYWISVHIEKLYNPRPTEPQPKFIIAPTTDDICRWLAALPSTANLYLDIETRMDYGLLCIGLCSDTGPIFCVPVYDYTGRLQYDNIAVFWRELNRAGRRCELVIHNAMFDLIVLGKYYNYYGVNKVYDTMIAQHRICAEAEKSLSHAIAQWTELPFHKDKFVVPQNPQQQVQLYDYNCRDVWAMRLIKKSQLNFARGRQGMLSSIQAGNRMIKPFLINSLMGVEVNEPKLASIKSNLAREIKQLYRILTMLIGYELNCASPKQVGEYLYEKMGYKVSVRTDTGAPGTGKKALYKLVISTNNPALKVLLKLKVTQKKLSMMEFESI